MKTDHITNVLVERSDEKLPQIDGHEILGFVSFDIADIVEFRRIPLLSIHGKNERFLLGVTLTPFDPLPGESPEPSFKFKSKEISDGFVRSVAEIALAAASFRSAKQ